MRGNKLYIYGTTFNCEKYLPAVMKSLEHLKPLDYELFIVDNYSKDNTYEILKSYPFVHVFQAKCSRGKGRNLAMIYLMECMEHDYPNMYIDFDNVITPQMAMLIKKNIKKLKPEDNAIYPFGLTDIVNLEWKDLNAHRGLGKT